MAGVADIDTLLYADVGRVWRDVCRRVGRWRRARLPRTELALPPFAGSAARPELPGALRSRSDAGAREFATAAARENLTAEAWTDELLAFEWLAPLDDQAFCAVVERWCAHAGRGELLERGTEITARRTSALLVELDLRRARLTRAFVEGLARRLVAALASLERELEPDEPAAFAAARALGLGARLFAGPRAAAWEQRAERTLERALARQVLSDGVHVSCSPRMHARATAHLLQAALLARRNDRPAWIARLRPLVQAALDLAHPDGGASFADEPSELWTARELIELYCALGGEALTPQKHVELSQAGFYGLRHREACVLIRAGARSSALDPSQAPVAAVEWSVRGQRFLVAPLPAPVLQVGDAFPRPRRSLLELARAPLVACERFESTGETIVACLRHEGFAHLPGAPIGWRRIVAGPTTLRLSDFVGEGRAQTVRSSFGLHPALTLRREGERALLLERDGVAVLFETRLPFEVLDLGPPGHGRTLVVHLGVAPCGGHVGFSLAGDERAVTVHQRRVRQR